MAGKAGMQQPGNRQPRFRAAPDTAYVAGLADPANGAKVPRCAVCGMPQTDATDLLPGMWRYAARPPIDLTLCDRCAARLGSIEPDAGTWEDAA
jgi:hypothetical protein